MAIDSTVQQANKDQLLDLASQVGADVEDGATEESIKEAIKTRCAGSEWEVWDGTMVNGKPYTMVVKRKGDQLFSETGVPLSLVEEDGDRILRSAKMRLLLQAKQVFGQESHVSPPKNVVSEAVLDRTKSREFEGLYAGFLENYVPSAGGEEHWHRYPRVREEARRSFEEILKAREGGEDVTDRVLLELLPHRDTEHNRARGAWIHIAPAITRDIKDWFEGAGWTDPDDWPRVSSAILDFLKRCVEHPEALEEACAEFSDLDYSTGFQAGMLSPALNALAPEHFLLINSKSHRTISYLADENFGTSLEEYPKINERAWQLLQALPADFSEPAERLDVLPADIFDAFCHWLVAVRKHAFSDAQYWKVAPGKEAWNWESCRDGDFMAVGWSELGDISQLTHSEFEKRAAEVSEREGWEKTAGLEQLWKFATEIRVGDYIVANRGTSRVLGIGRVTGPYYFEPETRHGHRLPVDWEDTKTRKVEQGGWRRTLVSLDAETFEKIREAPIVSEGTTTGHSDGEDGTGEQRPRPVDGAAFSHQAFELLADLHENPVREVYTERKGEFHEHLIEPFRELFAQVVEELPPAIKDVMETESRVFSRIPKNDWGRGGAWDFYWGALYPRGGKRIEDAQLFLCMKHNTFRFGFSLGDYSTEQSERFVHNARQHGKQLWGLMGDSLNDTGAVFGESTGRGDNEMPGGDVDPKDWLNDPAEHDLIAEVIFTREDVLAMPAEDLRDRVASTLETFFPLVLLAVSDEPMSEIAAYLGATDGDEFEIQPEFPLAECAALIHMDQGLLERWIRSIERKGQGVFYGPPGTGKTYVARHLARHLVGGSNGFVDLLQFHPAYAYEDFIQGIRPESQPDGSLRYPLVRGRFLRFCEDARRRDGRCVLITDEINRANISRVFGELMYLLEYREDEVPLAAGGRRFSIPENVRIIGTMNTADRSIALVDHALRRRFAFIPLYPDYEILRRFHEGSEFPIDGLVRVLERLNDEIGDRNYSVGVSFFLHEELGDELEGIWRLEIEPYLEEYFFDQPDRVRQYRWDNVASALQ